MEAAIKAGKVERLARCGVQGGGACGWRTTLLVLITRNLKDVADLPVAVANSWDPDGSGL